MTLTSRSGSFSRLAVLLLAALALSVALAYVFWPQVSTGFRLFTGDHYDGLIALAIHEHWWHALRGLASVTKVAWFHPWSGTLAYNDGYLLHGLLYAPLRALSAAPFLAADLAQMIQKAVGFAAILLIGRRILDLPWTAAIFAAILGTTLPALLQELHHAQFAALGPGLLAAWMGMEAARSILSGRYASGLAWGTGAALLYGLVLLTSFYVAWGLGLLAFVATMLLLLAAPRESWACLRPSRRGALTVALLGILLLLAVLPGLLLYLPVVKQSGLHPRSVAQIHGGGFGSLVALGDTSLLWGWLHAWATGRGRAVMLNGFAPGFLLASVVALVIAFHRARMGNPTARLLVAMGSAALLLSFMSFSWWRFWPWQVIWWAVPGAHAFRAPSRIMFISGGALALLIGWLVWQVGRRSHTAALALMALLLADGWRSHVRLVDAREEMARLASVPLPPVGCAVFAALRPREGVPATEVAALYSHNVDAMMLAAMLNLPTLNGYSTFFPPGWDLNHPEASTYLARVVEEADRHGLSAGLCGFDFQALRWSGPGLVLPKGGEPILQPGQPLAASSALPSTASMLARGWATAELWGAWTIGPVARLVLRLPTGWSGDGVVELTGNGFARTAAGQELRMTAAPVPEHGPWVEARVAATPQRLRIPFKAEDVRDGVLRITLQVTEPTSPASLGYSADSRTLGFGLQNVTLVP